MNILAARLHNQQIAVQKWSNPTQVVQWFGAVQAQDLLGSLYAVALRSQNATEATVEQAIAERKLVRTWPLRGTIHFVLPENARWMVRLNGERQIAKIKNNYRKANLTPDTFKKAGDVFIAELAGGKQRTRPHLHQAMRNAGIDTSMVNGEQRGMHLFVYWALKGLLCIGPRQGKQQTFALLDEWVQNHRDVQGEAALRELAIMFVRSHGPATVKDFAWWAGLGLTEANRGLALAAGQLTKKHIDSQEYWFTPGAKQTDASGAYLLPPFDEYTIAYADRSAALGANDPRSIGYGLLPNLIINGVIAGTWRRMLKKDTVTITLKPLTPLGPHKKAIQQAADRYAHILGLPNAVVEYI